MKAEADNSNFNFSQLCDDVSFAGGPVSVIHRAPIWLSTSLETAELRRTDTQTNSTGYPSESASSSKWHAWYASRCPDRRLSTWPDDCRLVSDSTLRSLRSADVSTCVVPPTLSGYGDRTFAAAGPRLWSHLALTSIGCGRETFSLFLIYLVANQQSYLLLFGDHPLALSLQA